MVKTYVGQKIIHLESVDSTNNYTAKLLKEGEIDSGAVILSDIQTEGRGQRSNSWQSLPFENLTFSFLIKPITLKNISSITINHCVSLALVEFILSEGLKPQLKWPNDIYVNNLKIAGILIENSFKSNSITSSIVGVGININQLKFESLNATSLSLITGKKYSVKGVLFDIIYQLNKQFERFETTSASFMKRQYDETLYTLGDLVEFSSKGETFYGKIQGTTEDGSLVILIEGKQAVFRNGEVSQVME